MGSGARMLGLVGLLLSAGCSWGGGSAALNAVESRIRERQSEIVAASSRPIDSPAVSQDTHEDESNWDSATLTLGDFRLRSEPDDEPAAGEGRFDPSNRSRPLPGLGETIKRDLKQFPTVLWDDTKAVYTNKQNLLVLGLTYGASSSIQEGGPDNTVEDSFRDGGKLNKGFRDAGGLLGNPAVHFGLAGLWYLIGQQEQNDHTYEVGKKLFRALTVSGLSTALGQAASWDRAPNGEWGTFPSGHTSSSFAFASVMDHEYGPVVGWPLYALSSFVAWTRLEDREHYLSDVVMGSVLGLVVGHTVASGGEPPKLFGGEIFPYADPMTGSTGVAWIKRIK